MSDPRDWALCQTEPWPAPLQPCTLQEAGWGARDLAAGHLGTGRGVKLRQKPMTKEAPDTACPGCGAGPHPRNGLTSCSSSEPDTSSWLKSAMHRRKFSYTSWLLSTRRTCRGSSEQPARQGTCWGAPPPALLPEPHHAPHPEPCLPPQPGPDLVEKGELLQGPVLAHAGDGQVFVTSQLHLLLRRQTPRSLVQLRPCLLPTAPPATRGAPDSPWPALAPGAAARAGSASCWPPGRGRGQLRGCCSSRRPRCL